MCVCVGERERERCNFERWGVMSTISKGGGSNRKLEHTVVWRRGSSLGVRNCKEDTRWNGRDGVVDFGGLGSLLRLIKDFASFIVFISPFTS